MQPLRSDGRTRPRGQLERLEERNDGAATCAARAYGGEAGAGGRDVGHTRDDLAEEGDGSVEQLLAPWCTGAGARRGVEDDGGVRARRNGRPAMMLDGDEVVREKQHGHGAQGSRRLAANRIVCLGPWRPAWQPQQTNTRTKLDARATGHDRKAETGTKFGTAANGYSRRRSIWTWARRSRRRASACTRDGAGRRAAGRGDAASRTSTRKTATTWPAGDV